MSRDPFICATWLVHTGPMSDSHVWHDPHTHAKSHSYMQHDSFACATCPMLICDMTHPYMQLLLVCLTRFIHMCDVTHSYVRCDSFICVSFTHSRRRSDLKDLRLEIYRVSRYVFWVMGTLFTPLKTCMKMWGLPWKRVWLFMGASVKTCCKFWQS